MNLVTVEERIAHIPRERYPAVGRLVGHFMDVTATATARGSFYNTREELQEATDAVHKEVLALDRGVYGMLLALPGVLDYSRQKGVVALLGQPGNGGPALLTMAQETRLIGHLTEGLPPQRRLKMFGKLKRARVNNARTRRLILEAILGQPNLEWAVVKYRRKIETALRHAWGVRMTSIIKSILGKAEGRWMPKERAILTANILAKNPYQGAICECISFALGNAGPWTLPKLRAYEAAKTQFRAGAELPPEVMEGIRSTYHQARSNADVLALTERQATTGQRIAIQRSAKAKGVEVAFDPRNYDLVQLYVYAYEMGMDDEIWGAIRKGAATKAAGMPMRYGQVGIVVDTSRSMVGSSEQKHRPMAVALAIKDVLEAASDQYTTRYTNGHFSSSPSPKPDWLPEPGGHTSLARTFLAVVLERPEAIFVITDGYENAPAGRFAEVVEIWRGMGNDTPVYQLSPVMAAETYGTRNLANDVPVLPVNQKINIGMGMVKLMLEQDFGRGLAALIEMTNIFYLEG